MINHAAFVAALAGGLPWGDCPYDGCHHPLIPQPNGRGEPEAAPWASYDLACEGGHRFSAPYGRTAEDAAPSARARHTTEVTRGV